MDNAVNDTRFHQPVNADNVRVKAAVRSREGLWRRNLRAVDVLCEVTNLRDSRRFRGGYGRRKLDDSAKRLLLIQNYHGDSSCILDRDKEKEKVAPASCAYICDGKFQSFRLLSRVANSERSLWQSLETNTEDEHKVN